MDEEDALAVGLLLEGVSIPCQVEYCCDSAVRCSDLVRLPLRRAEFLESSVEGFVGDEFIHRSLTHRQRCLCYSYDQGLDEFIHFNLLLMI